jgi:hypothetical protein
MVVNALVATSTVTKFVIWLPAIIVGFGIVAAVLILLGRAFVATVRESGHPRLLWGGLVALVGVILVLTWLGVELPKE